MLWLVVLICNVGSIELGRRVDFYDETLREGCSIDGAIGICLFFAYSSKVVLVNC